ncbi:MAG: PAS domain S-box protein [Syntrophobacteraceae bacterium]
MSTTETVNVLLIEKDESEYALVRGLLSESPFTEFKLDWVTSFEAGLEAVCLPCHDAVLVDYTLGERTGIDFLAEAGRKGCDPPMILLRGPDGEVDSQALDVGAVDCLTKGEISREVLERTIRYAIERKKVERELDPHEGNPEDSAASEPPRPWQTGPRLRKEILEREMAESALRHSEVKYRTLVENSLDIIYTVSLEAKILSLNPAFEQITGWSAREWIGKDYTPLIHPDDLPLIQDRRERSLRGETLEPAEVRVRAKSGEIITLEFNSTALLDGNTITGLIGTARDVTHRKRAEEELIHRNTFLNTVLESLSHPFYVLDARNYDVVMANSAASPDKLPRNTKCYALFHQGDAPCSGSEHFCPLQEIKKTKKPLITEHIHHDPDGTPRHVEIHAHPIFDLDGEVSLIIEYILDITDRKKMEEDLRGAHDELENRVRQRTAELARTNAVLRSEIRERRRAENALRLDEIRLEALLELSQMSWSSEEEVADYVLEQQVKLTGSKIGLIGFLDEDERILDLHTGATEHIPSCGLQEAPVRHEIAHSGVWADAVRKRRPIIINDPALLESGGKGLPCGDIPPQRLLSIPVFDGDRIVALAIVANKERDYDQSDVRQLTLLMDGMWKLMVRGRSAKALGEAESLAGIGRALSSVAHDMKTPLIAIGGFARLVQNHTPKTSPDWEKMEIVLKETRRLEHMVGNMLDFSRPLELEKTPEDIYHLIQESLDIARQIADKKGIELQVDLCYPGEPILMDGARVKQAILNLLINAIEATPKGRFVKLHCLRKGARLIVEVVDCGCGIPFDQRKDIFLPFFTTKKEGTGLGLPIVKKIAEAHKGRVEVIDNPKEGVTFRLVLPIH